MHFVNFVELKVTKFQHRRIENLRILEIRRFPTKFSKVPILSCEDIHIYLCIGKITKRGRATGGRGEREGGRQWSQRETIKRQETINSNILSSAGSPGTSSVLPHRQVHRREGELVQKKKVESSRDGVSKQPYVGWLRKILGKRDAKNDRAAPPIRARSIAAGERTLVRTFEIY